MRFKNFAAVCVAISFGHVEASQPGDPIASSTPTSSWESPTADWGSSSSPYGETSASSDTTSVSCALGRSSIGSECKVQTSFWYLNTELTALSPINSSPSQNYALNDLVASAQVTPFASDVNASQLTAAPRITFGKSHCNGWGIQTSYWDMRTSDGSGYAGPIVGPASVPDLNLINVQDSVRAYTLDLEATKRFQVCETQYWGTFGVRHASLQNATSSFAIGESVLNDLYTLSSLSETSFNGTGLTYSLMGIRPTKNKCLSVYGSGRLSNVFGNNTALAQTSAILSSPAGAANSTNGAIDKGSDALFISEFQTGLLYSRCLNQYGGKMFARGGFEYQYWNTADRNAFSTSFAGATGSSDASVTANGGDLKTQLVGFSLGAGYAW